MKKKKFENPHTYETTKELLVQSFEFTESGDSQSHSTNEVKD
jgi:hypothetical protein